MADDSADERSRPQAPDAMDTSPTTAEPAKAALESDKEVGSDS